MRKVLKSFFALAAVAVLSTGCKKDEVVEEKASVNIVHACPDAPGVDLLVDNVKVNTAPLAFDKNTGYLSVKAGARNFKVNATGTNTSVIDVTPTLAKGKSYTVFAANKLANIEAILVEDNLATPAAGKAHVRFVHLSPDAPAVDIAVKGGAVIFPNVAFKGNTAFTPVDAGTVDLEVRVAGSSTVALPVNGISLAAGKIYTIYAKGLLANGSIGATIMNNN